jgi:AraC-like DNA-binding protein
MDLTCEERPSDSALVETVWRSHAEHGGPFISMAAGHCEIVLTRLRGQTTLTVRGPETRATPAYCPDDAAFMGIIFKPGTFLSTLPPGRVKDRNDVNLPGAGGKDTFWLGGSAWQFPDFENVDTFIDWLAREGLLVHDPVVDTVLAGQPTRLSLRTEQRRFLQATGLTQNTLRQIERARYATRLLKQGTSILDTVYNAGYFDQPHLTRSLKHFIGQTPAQLQDENRTTRLSFLYNTTAPVLQYEENGLLSAAGA